MKAITGWFAVLLAVVSVGSLQAHHALTKFDITKAVRVKGTVVEFRQINPHSIIFVDETGTDGEIQRWAVEGPGPHGLTRLGFAQNALKPGDVIEVCGYVTKELTIWQLANPNSSASRSGRLIDGEVLVMPDGKQQTWSDYGVHKCM